MKFLHFLHIRVRERIKMPGKEDHLIMCWCSVLHTSWCRYRFCNNAMCKFLDCVTWVQLNQIEQRSREKKMFPRRARKYLTMIENMLTVGVCWITCTQKVWAETKSIKSPRQCQLPAGGTGEQKGGQNLRMSWIWTLDMSRPAPRGRPRPWPACSAAARSPQSSAGSTVAWVDILPFSWGGGE